MATTQHKWAWYFQCFRSSHAYHYVFGSVLACVQCVQMFQKLSCLPQIYMCSCLCIVYSNVSEALMLPMCVGFCSCLCIVCSNLSEALMLAICVHCFCSCLCKVCSHKLSYSLCGLCLSLSLSSLITLPQTVRLFHVSLRSQAPQQQYTELSFSSMRRRSHSHKLTSSHALRYYTVGIPF